MNNITPSDVSAAADVIKLLIQSGNVQQLQALIERVGYGSYTTDVRDSTAVHMTVTIGAKLSK